jgi:predicted nucleic acid-binding protein
MQKAVLDACVLAPAPLFDTLLRLAEKGFYKPVWSDEILAEVERTLIQKLGVEPTSAKARLSTMVKAFPDASIAGFQSLIDRLTNHPKDRHVLAAAIKASAPNIVTANLKDFPATALKPHGISAIHPDDFMLGFLETDQDRVLETIEEQRESYTNPKLSTAEFLDALRSTVPMFCQRVEHSRLGPDRERMSADFGPQLNEVPLPFEAKPMAEVLDVFLGEDHEPDITTPLGAAVLWWKFLFDIDNYRPELELLTWRPAAWQGFKQAKQDIDDWSLASGVHFNEEEPDKIAYVKFIPPTSDGGIMFASAPLNDAHVLTLVKCDDGIWRAWGLSRNAIPTANFVLGREPLEP